ncbi:C4-dicarboxylate transporter, DctM subunit [[Clostridium] aminophilum]|uniref:C4-dicarboxylate transporter, DctM subunit n=1 Tax=[Clostridium] aminophilum TaxID=1526 RepID=A0A1I0G4T8_9FIRM|nr:TRAP transporter large permease [[Clostridium] aminophilum]SET65931.1 C4-dicarboxylate transporter, DctM subunit [[Clostridium] aminophilum]
MTLALFLCFAITLLVGFPLAWVLILSAMVPGSMDPSFIGNVQFVLRSIIGGADSSSLLAAPLFILSGIIMAKGGISRKIFDVFAYFLCRVPGGMPCAVIVTCLFYGAISGSGTATCAAVGAMTIPILLDLGYDTKFSGALVATAAGLGVIIPPSVPFIMYGTATGVSIGKLFIAGVIPGIVIALCLMIYSVIFCVRKGENRERILEATENIRKNGFWPLFKDGIWALLTPVILLGGIYSGIVTTTEVACISVIYALLVSIFVYRTVKPSEVLNLLTEACKTLAPLGLILAVATAFGRILTLLQIPMMLSGFIMTHFTSKIAVLLIMNLMLLLIGMVMDTGPALMILGPMLLPMTSALGVDPVHLGIIMTVNMAIGFVTPPFGVTLFVAAPIVGEPPMALGKRAMPFIATFLAALILITFVPQFSMCLL